MIRRGTTATVPVPLLQQPGASGVLAAERLAQLSAAPAEPTRTSRIVAPSDIARPRTVTRRLDVDIVAIGVSS